jgi:hypothetical protein
MKNIIFSSLAAISMVASFPVSVGAMPSDELSSQSYAAVGMADTPPETVYDGGPKLWSFGVYSQFQKRDLEIKNGFTKTESANLQHILGFIGYDATRWLTLETGIGQSKASADTISLDGDLQWMAGLHFRILDYLFPTEHPFMCHFEADGQYNYCTSDSSDEDAVWNEFFASFTVSFISGIEDSQFGRSIGLYAGPAFSAIYGELDQFGLDYDIKSSDSVGGIGGVLYKPNDYLSLKLEAQVFGGSRTLGSSLTLHF